MYSSEGRQAAVSINLNLKRRYQRIKIEKTGFDLIMALPLYAVLDVYCSPKHTHVCVCEMNITIANDTARMLMPG